jgi:NTP pyrophosphatase (non-canonical NTP hydrolase)
MSYNGYPLEDMETDLVRISRLINAHNAGRDPEAILWGRVAKVAEEAGEVIDALVFATGQNPRKGEAILDVSSMDFASLKKELLDVVCAALCAYEHLDDHKGRSMHDLRDFILTRKQRINA